MKMSHFYLIVKSILQLYTNSLEVNSLLDIDQVRHVITEGYGYLSAESQRANTNEEREIVEKLKGY